MPRLTLAICAYAVWRRLPMKTKLYSCNSFDFQSYLASEIVSFVEYKVNVGGCVPESFTPVMQRFDAHCCLHPETAPCLKQETVLSFLDIRETRKSSARRVASVIRSFGKYLAAVLRLDDIYIVPVLIKNKGKTFVPYVFNHGEISALLKATVDYRPRQDYTVTPNMLNCMPCIFTMLYCTGMRVSEVSCLRIGDVDLEQMIIHINYAKNDNRRIVTISQSLADACSTYLEKSETAFRSGVYFFDSGSSYNEGKVSSKRIYTYFRRFLESAGIEHRGLGFGPRLHDIRVTFAVHSLQQLSRLPGDINTHILSLSVFMGHQSIYCTQEYLWLTGELFQDILDKMEDYTSFVSDIFEEKAGEWDDE
jgi:integrase